MVVLAVSWMAKPGQESAVAELFSKLSEESRKEHKAEARNHRLHSVIILRRDEPRHVRAPLAGGDHSA